MTDQAGDLDCLVDDAFRATERMIYEDGRIIELEGDEVDGDEFDDVDGDEVDDDVDVDGESDASAAPSLAIKVEGTTFENQSPNSVAVPFPNPCSGSYLKVEVRGVYSHYFDCQTGLYIFMLAEGTSLETYYAAPGTKMLEVKWCLGDDAARSDDGGGGGGGGGEEGGSNGPQSGHNPGNGYYRPHVDAGASGAGPSIPFGDDGANHSRFHGGGSASYNCGHVSEYSLGLIEGPKVEGAETSPVVSGDSSDDDDDWVALYSDTQPALSPRSDTSSTEWESVPLRPVDSHEETAPNLPVTDGSSIEEHPASAEVTTTEAAVPQQTQSSEGGTSDVAETRKVKAAMLADWLYDSNCESGENFSDSESRSSKSSPSASASPQGADLGAIAVEIPPAMEESNTRAEPTVSLGSDIIKIPPKGVVAATEQRQVSTSVSDADSMRPPKEAQAAEFNIHSDLRHETSALRLHTEDPVLAKPEQARQSSFNNLHQPRAVPHGLGLGLVITDDDLCVASHLSSAVYEVDPKTFLESEKWSWSAKLQQVRCGDRSMDSPLSPYVLAVTSTSGRCCDERGHEREERTVWVAFRGTDNTKDVLTDAKIIPGKMNIGYVHSGFLDRIKALGKQIESLYEWASAQNSNLKPSEPIVRVIFTGHSLGGAMAQVALLHVWAERDLNACRHEHVGAIAFGSPLVGNRRMFGKLRELALNDRILNVVHTDDILPILLNYAMSTTVILKSATGLVENASSILDVIRMLVGANKLAAKGLNAADEALKSFVPRLTAIMGALQKAGSRHLEYLPLGRLLVMEKSPVNGSHQCRLMEKPDEVRRFAARMWQPDETTFQGGISAYGMLHYMTSILTCSHLPLPGRNPTGGHAPVDIMRAATTDLEGDFLQPVVYGSSMRLAPGQVKLVVRGANLHFLNTAHPRFVILALDAVKTVAKVDAEVATTGNELTLRVKGDAASILSRSNFRTVRIHLRKYFDVTADRAGGDIEDALASASYVAVNLRMQDRAQCDGSGDARLGRQPAADDLAGGEPSLEMFEAALQRLCVDLFVQLQATAEAGSPASRVNAVVARSAAARSLAELCDGPQPPRPGEFATALRDALTTYAQEMVVGKPAVLLREDVVGKLRGRLEPVFKRAVEDLRGKVPLDVDRTQHSPQGIQRSNDRFNLVRRIGSLFFTDVAKSMRDELGDCLLEPYSSNLMTSLYFMCPKQVLYACLHKPRDMERLARDLVIAGNLGDVADCDKPCPERLTIGRATTNFAVFESRRFEDVTVSLLQSSQLRTLQFLRKAMCLSTVRRLLDAIYLNFVGEGRVGKSTLLQAMFGLNIRAGRGAANQTTPMSSFSLSMGGAGPPITVFDCPGTTDMDVIAASMFSKTMQLPSMTVIVWQLERGRREAIQVCKTFASRPFCVVVPHLDQQEVPEDPEEAERRIAALRAEAATSLGVDERRVHLFWNEHAKRHAQPLVADWIMRQPAFASRTVESVRRFLFEQMMEQLPRLREFEAEVRTQLGILR